MASFGPFSSGPNFEGDSKFIWKEGGLIQASLPLNLRWQKNQDKQNQSRGVTKTNIGDTKTFLADIAREENKTEEAIQLYKAAEQAYREAKNFYPQYPYIARGLNRVSQTIRSLAPLKTPQPEKWVKLDVPIKKIPTQSVASSSAEALTAVVSYLIRSEVHACNMLNLVSNKDFNCCDPKNYLVCLTGPDPMQAVGKLERLYDLPVELEQSLSYMGIVSYIDKGLPVIAIFDDNSGYPPLVISGYGPSDMLVISTTSLERERTISYEQMLKMGWRKTVLVQRGKSVLIRGEAEEYAYAIVKMYLDKDFYRLAEQFSHNIPRQALLNRLMLAWGSGVIVCCSQNNNSGI